MNLGLILALALAAKQPELAHCSATLPPDVSMCTATHSVTWNQAKRVIFELNQTMRENTTWQLPTAAQLGDAKLPCDASQTETELWWMTSAFLKHGNEILVGAYHCATEATEFVPVNQPLKLLLLRNGQGQSTQQHGEWQQAVANTDYTIDYRERADGTLELRATLTVKAKLGSFLHLLEDVEVISSWLARAEKATVIARPDTQSHVVHTVFSGFFLVSRRDMVTRSRWHQDPNSKTLTITVANADDEYKVPAHGVRITNLAAQWQLTPVGNGELNITYQGYADPAGALPQFVARSAALEALKKTLARLPSALENYQRSYEGIVEP